MNVQIYYLYFKIHNITQIFHFSINAIKLKPFTTLEFQPQILDIYFSISLLIIGCKIYLLHRIIDRFLR